MEKSLALRHNASLTSVGVLFWFPVSCGLKYFVTDCIDSFCKFLVNVSIYEISIAAVMPGIYGGDNFSAQFYVSFSSLSADAYLFFTEAELYFIEPTSIYNFHSEQDLGIATTVFFFFFKILAEITHYFWSLILS